MSQNCGICGSFLPKLDDGAGRRTCPKCGTEFESPALGAPIVPLRTIQPWKWAGEQKGGPDSPMVCGACPDWQACAEADRCARATDDDYKLPSLPRRKGGLMKPSVDPVCLVHGLRKSEHRCLYCCLCFKPLTIRDCHVLPDGSPEDVCVPCWEAERGA